MMGQTAATIAGLVVLFVVCVLALSSIMSLAPGPSNVDGNVIMKFDVSICTTHYQREWLKSKPPVKFDPYNKEHLAALALMRLYGRLHPTLRFEFDPAKHDNAYDGMLDTVLNELVLKADIRALAEKSLTGAKIKKPAPTKRMKSAIDQADSVKDRIHLIAKV